MVKICLNVWFFLASTKVIYIQSTSCFRSDMHGFTNFKNFIFYQVFEKIRKTAKLQFFQVLLWAFCEVWRGSGFRASHNPIFMSWMSHWVSNNNRYLYEKYIYSLIIKYWCFIKFFGVECRLAQFLSDW